MVTPEGDITRGNDDQPVEKEVGALYSTRKLKVKAKAHSTIRRKLSSQ